MLMVADPVKLTEQGLKDGLASLGQILDVLKCRLRDAEARLATAEQDVGEFRKLASFTRSAAEAYRQRLNTVQAAPPRPDG